MVQSESSAFNCDNWNLIVVGGGAAGFMTAITAAEAGIKDILILEATAYPLGKVKISGGGRCNITHACWNAKELAQHYPRGTYDLLNPFSSFGSGDAVAWFADHGLNIVQESDGRMFPNSQSSDSVIYTLRRAAEKAGIQIQTNALLETISIKSTNNFKLYIRSKKKLLNQVLSCHYLVLATGSHPSGHRLGISLGHRIIAPTPSLFSIAIAANSLQELAGVVIDPVLLKLNLSTSSFSQRGPVLITHTGFSGPSILKLTAFAAFALRDVNYQASINVNWAGGSSLPEVHALIDSIRKNYAKRQLINWRPWPELSRRLWIYLIKGLSIDPYKRWADISKLEIQGLVNSIVNSSYTVKGKGPFGEEFVTAGGIHINEIHLATMQSTIIPRLYFAGEIMNIDGITGGFNFQHCWTSGWLAGRAIAASY